MHAKRPGLDGADLASIGNPDGCSMIMRDFIIDAG